MSVYQQGEQRDEGKEKKKDFFDEVGEEFDKWGNKLSKMFTSKSKHWEKKGEGHSLGTAADAEAVATKLQAVAFAPVVVPVPSGRSNIPHNNLRREP